jgi:ATP-dependent Lon protease
MEVISLSGYTEEEKLKIAKIHIVPKQLELNGLGDGELVIEDSAIKKIIEDYTMESGVRNLEREIAKVSRKAVRKIVSDEKIEHVKVDDTNVSKFLGVTKYSHLVSEKVPKIGVVTGLAWTETGGDVLEVEALQLPGSGNIISTGKLGEVMQESIKAAYSYVKSQHARFDIDKDIFCKTDIHIHVPEGAVPKDGPSAGITICTAIVSALTKRRISANIGMTGEITLVGKVLGIGGLKEKLLAARRHGVKKVFIPEENKKDLPELPKVLLDEIDICTIKHIDEILNEVFV